MRSLWFLALLPAVGLGACSTSDEGDTPSTPPVETPDPTALEILRDENPDPAVFEAKIEAPMTHQPRLRPARK